MGHPTTPEQIILEAERDLLVEKIGYLDLRISSMQEGAWTGSMGGNDPDFQKLRGGLMRFWMEKARTSPHPFTYCVRHLRKHVANPERLCAWLKDQALGTTSWRKGNKKIGEADAHEWEPTADELREALQAYEEVARELGVLETDDGGTGAGEGSQGDQGGSSVGTPPPGGDSGSPSTETGNEGTPKSGAPKSGANENE